MGPVGVAGDLRLLPRRQLGVGRAQVFIHPRLQAADFLGGVFRDIQREAEQQQARKNASRKSVPDDDDSDDDIDEEDDEIIDELFTVTTSTTKAGKVTVKIEIDADGIETLLDTYEDEDDVWMILQSVGSRVAEEFGDAILDDEDED